MCKSSGQWNSLEKLILRNRRKTDKDTAAVDVLNEKDLIESYLRSINETTVELNSLTEESRQKIIKKFKLPVSRYILRSFYIYSVSKNKDEEANILGFFFKNVIREDNLCSLSVIISLFLLKWHYLILFLLFWCVISFIRYFLVTLCTHFNLS